MHVLQGRLAANLEGVWLAALEDAGISSDRALLFPFTGSASPDGQGAVYMRRGLCIDINGLDGDVLGRLNDEATGFVYAYRVLLWTTRSIEGSAALIRHELEHARQIDARPEVADLHDLAEAVVRVASEGSGRLYQQIPTEADANAASGVWVRSYFGSDRIDRLIDKADPDVAALRSTQPPRGSVDLPERVVEFLASIADCCRRLAEQWEFDDFSRILDVAWPGGGRSWARMTQQEPGGEP